MACLKNGVRKDSVINWLRFLRVGLFSMQSCYYNSFGEYSLLGNGCHGAVTNDDPIGHDNTCLSALSVSH